MTAMDDQKRKSELDLQEEQINALWAKVEAREESENKLAATLSELDNLWARLT
jgi:hypothetical protein